jgi:hypothetical protein
MNPGINENGTCAVVLVDGNQRKGSLPNGLNQRLESLEQYIAADSIGG